MAYKVLWEEGARDDLADIDKAVARKIIEKVTGYVASDPVAMGKPLKGVYKGLYRYRFGDWRIIYALDREAEEMIVLRIGHRRNVYDIR